MPTEDGAPPRRGLLIDYGGVLTTDVFASFQAFCKAEGLEPTKVAEMFRGDPEARQLLFDLEVGKLSEEEFEPRFGAVLGIAEPTGLIDRLFAGMKSDHAMLNALRAARDAGVRTGLLSNSWGKGRYDRSLFPELFDGVVISGEVGLRKPDQAIYQLGAEAIDLPPEACVFVDDLPGNLKPARELGMATIHHTSAEQTVAELEPLLGVRLR
ncbi:MAG: putative hydrolase of the superfamily [Solirubrobacteraceae bacterium]|nr:putative hydrolase of the superfamily [Solirubrobacteraceae bacterium]